jgi:hypothetical protein
MTEKWTIRELDQDDFPYTSLQYMVVKETGEVVSVHHWLEDAQQMVAFPQIRDALYEALAYIEETARSFGVEPDKDAWERMSNALQVELLPAAKGEG